MSLKHCGATVCPTCKGAPLMMGDEYSVGDALREVAKPRRQGETLERAIADELYRCYIGGLSLSKYDGRQAVAARIRKVVE